MEPLPKKNLPKVGLRHWLTHPINILMVLVLIFLITGIILAVVGNFSLGRWFIVAGILCAFAPIGLALVFDTFDKIRKRIK